MTDLNENGNPKVSASWLLNIVTLVMIALLSFWGRSMAGDLRDTRVDMASAVRTMAVQAAEISTLFAVRQEDKERLSRIELKIDQLIDTKRNR